ncbi:MAG TPA: bifunctional 5,10-methylenetetrahydrofolate dehydrogenase/5,10-methenyltetrahydrofolate cyclohydrolase [Aggregatilineales bacterium]|nr:bifunctional 5,10-methylenetetrahydrofolate dehydrogenase/5,10-methenyltetrahydrofolate cyclohydrolase [Anaerolineales bacterium]HRE47320.1 bifunctional 5,10-methylenetetrahydrofolate dehydrogenase/5,10-methenyltetrahydrofolate cyclohydrolase [Aggregatilineales bacterium]
MPATIIDGKAIAARLREQIKTRTDALYAARGIRPGLAAVLVGDNPASHTYVSMKRRACAEVGIDSIGIDLPKDASQAQVEDAVRGLNERADIHGILVQLPLPNHIDEEAVLAAVGLAKDVDGFHPMNIGRLAQKGREPLFVPATPAGVIRLLEVTGVPFSGANAVVLGRSNIVGMPVALLLTGRDCTVTICHSRTRDLPTVTRTADILVAAVGRPGMVKGSWIKPGAVVIDVGTTSVPDPTRKSGSRIAGDVDYEEALSVAGAITPVPGGVGPMTIALLLENTLKAAERV